MTEEEIKAQEAFLKERYSKPQKRDKDPDGEMIRAYFAKPQRRALALPMGTVDAEKRTVELAFSSETPVIRYGWDGDYAEILSHAPGAMRTERLNGGLAALFNHDRNRQIGKIVEKSGRIDKDKIGRATVLFGRGELAAEKMQDVQDGILGHVSVGYEVHGYTVENNADGTVTVRITDWEPLEISLVTVPADASVGVGRAKPTIPTVEPVGRTQEEIKTMSNKLREYLKKRGLITDTATEGEAYAAFWRMSEREQAEALGSNPEAATDTERERSLAILALGDAHKMSDQAREYVREKKSVEDFKTLVLEERAKNPNKFIVPGVAGFSATEARQYSIGRALRSMVEKNPAIAGFEREVHETLLKQREENGQDTEVRGLLIPLESHPLIIARQHMKRAMNTSAVDVGGALIANEILVGEFISALYERSLLLQLGARALPGLVGGLSIPRLNSGATTYHVAEGAGPAASADNRFGNVVFSPKTIAAKQSYTRRLLKQSDPIISMIIAEDIAAAITSGMDQAGFQGTGANDEPLGILGQTGINTVEITTAGAPTWGEVVEFETALETDLTLLGSLAYVVAPGVKGNLKTTARAAGTVAGFIWDNNEVNGYKAFSTTHMPANGALFGNFMDVWFALWGDLDLKTDDTTDADAGGFVLRGFQDYDVNVRRPTAFCKNVAPV